MTGEPIRRRRGEPLVALAAIGLAWVGARVILWEDQLGGETALARAIEVAPVTAMTTASDTMAAEIVPNVDPTRHRSTRALDALPASVSRSTARAALLSARVALPAAVSGLHPSIPRPLARDVAVPSELLRPRLRSVTALFPAAAKRWRVDGWAGWRPGGGLPQVGTGAPLALAYGGSQLGLVARFDLGSGERHPQGYLRAVHAPVRPAQSDLAAGAGLRPFAAVPVRVQAEARLTRTADDTFVRPAILAVTELPPVALPLGLRGEAYAQAGWVGGRYATGFADGQARIDRALAIAGPAELRLGAGAWGGAQKFVSRFDVGPSLTLDLHPGRLPARLSLDYRKRVAGNARPGDGVAVTLSTGF